MFFFAKKVDFFRKKFVVSKKILSLRNYLPKKRKKMKSILLFIFSLLASALIAQPTTLDMKQRYYMKGEKNIIQLKGGCNPLMATKDEEGNYFYVGSAIFDGQVNGLIGTYINGEDISYKRDDVSKIYDCFAQDGYYYYAGNSVVSQISITDNKVQKNKSNKDGIGYQRLVPCGDEVLVSGVDKMKSPMTPAYHRLSLEGFNGDPYTMPEMKNGYFPDNDGYKLKNDMIAANDKLALWAYITKNDYSDYSTAALGLFAILSQDGGGGDRIDVKAAVDRYVSNFKPYTRYENIVYEEFYKVQWALSGIHPKEDGTFLITVSFIHWTTTASGKAGYQKGILGVEYDPNGGSALDNTWVVFPWEVREATSMQEKLEINPYYTHYVGENDIAVFDQETGNLFAINSDLDACKSSDELGTCGKKTKELQKWLVNERFIRTLDLDGGYFLNFVGSNTAHESGKKKSIHLICSQKRGSQLQTVDLDFK